MNSLNTMTHSSGEMAEFRFENAAATSICDCKQRMKSTPSLSSECVEMKLCKPCTSFTSHLHSLCGMVRYRALRLKIQWALWEHIRFSDCSWSKQVTVTVTSFIRTVSRGPKILIEKTNKQTEIRQISDSSNAWNLMHDVTVSLSAFLACHQCQCAGSSLAWGLNLRALVCGSSPGVFSGYSGFLPSFIG